MRRRAHLLTAALILGLVGASSLTVAEESAPEAFGPYAVTVTRVRIPMPLDPNGPEGISPRSTPTFTSRRAPARAR